MKTSFQYNSQSSSLDLTPAGKGYQIQIGDQTLDAEVLRAENGKLDLLINHQRVTAYVSVDNAKRWVTIRGRTFMLTKESAGARRKGSGVDHAGGLAAPMPGQVRSVAVSVGESVKKGQTLLTIEAMKMEIRIQARADGVVKVVHVKQGQTVEREQILVEIGDAL